MRSAPMFILCCIIGLTGSAPVHAAWVDHDAANTGIVAVDGGKVLDSLGQGWVVTMFEGDFVWERDNPSEDPPMSVDQIRYWSGQSLVTVSGDYWIWSSGVWTNVGPVPSAASVGDPIASPLRTATAVPNPASVTTDLRFALSEPASVSVRILDATGRTVRDVAETQYPTGDHSIAWDGRDSSGRNVPAGVYFARIAAGPLTVIGRIVITR